MFSQIASVGFLDDRGGDLQVATGITALDLAENVADQRLGDGRNGRRVRRRSPGSLAAWQPGSLAADHAADHLAENRAAAKQVERELVERLTRVNGVSDVGHTT